MAGKTSQENGKLGGRPKSNHTLTSEVVREQIATMLQPRLSKIIGALVKKAEKGDLRAIKELFDRAFGKPVQPEPPPHINICFRDHIDEMRDWTDQEIADCLKDLQQTI